MIVTPKDVIRMARGDVPYIQISQAMGKTNSYVQTMISRSSLSAQVMTDILDVLGYDVIVRQRTTRDETRISPSREEVIVPYAVTLSIQDDGIRELLQEYADDGTLEDRLRGLIA